MGSTLNFTYIGYTPQNVKVTDRSVYNVTLATAVEQLNEVVVTALGIKREQKALSYNVQQVKADEISGIKAADFINSLNGKVAGVTINSSSSGVGESQQGSDAWCEVPRTKQWCNTGHRRYTDV